MRKSKNSGKVGCPWYASTWSPGWEGRARTLRRSNGGTNLTFKPGRTVGRKKDVTMVSGANVNISRMTNYTASPWGNAYMNAW